MADDAKTVYGTDAKGRSMVVGYKGSRSGESFPTDQDLKDKKDREAFDKEKGWSGLGGAARRPAKTAYEQQFSEWRKVQAKAAGQAKALAPTPAPK